MYDIYGIGFSYLSVFKLQYLQMNSSQDWVSGWGEQALCTHTVH